MSTLHYYTIKKYRAFLNFYLLKDIPSIHSVVRTWTLPVGPIFLFKYSQTEITKLPTSSKIPVFFLTLLYNFPIFISGSQSPLIEVQLDSLWAGTLGSIFSSSCWYCLHAHRWSTCASWPHFGIFSILVPVFQSSSSSKWRCYTMWASVGPLSIVLYSQITLCKNYFLSFKFL